MGSVSIEAPEVRILGSQLHEALPGLNLEEVNVDGVERLQRHGFVNQDTSEFARLTRRHVERVRWRGAGIIIDFEGAAADHNGLLGMDFLGRFPHGIDMARQVIRWAPNE